GCDFGSTTAKAVVLSAERELLFSCYALSKGNPIEDAQSLFRQVSEAGFADVAALALTGYGKDLLKDVLGSDVAVGATVGHAKAMPALAMGCGVFLQSDIVNQQRKGWSAEEIMAALAAVLPVNVWIYAGQLQNLRSAGRKFVLQGGTHRNQAVVKAQLDFIRSKVPDAEVVLHPYSGEAAALGPAPV